jgi:hypothetical protein
MKKILTLIICIISLQVFSQSFYKGALVANLNYGFDIYRVRYHTALKNNAGVSKDTTDGAASSGPSLGIEYGVTKWLGIGVCGKYDTYFTSKDKYTGIRPSVNGGEIGLIVNFHIVRTNIFNLVAGVDAGYSHLIYRTNDVVGTEVYGSGSWFNIHLTPRFYFGRFGICSTINIPFINYPNMTTSNATLNQTFISAWHASGFGLTFGIQYRFLKAK